MIYLGLFTHHTLNGTPCALRGCGKPADRWCAFLLSGNAHAVALCNEHAQASEVAVGSLAGEPDVMPKSLEHRKGRREYDRRRKELAQALAAQ